MLSAYCPCSGSVKEENKEGRYHIDGTNLEFKIKYKAEELDAELPKPQSLFVDKTYQALLEDCPSKDTEAIYITVYEQGTAIGVIQAQSTLVKGSESLNLDVNSKGFRNSIKNAVIRNYNRRWFVVGNLLLTGNFGMQFKGKTTRESFVILDIITKHALPIIEKEKEYKFTFLFYKDFSEEEAAQSEALAQSNFYCFKSDPSMIFHIRKDWNTFEDYLAAMSSKYRVRAKRAFKKGKNLERMDLTYEQLNFYKHRIHELYHKISHSVDFNLVDLDLHYFPEMKKRLKDDFKLIAYFVDGEMIGYFTTIKDHKETHAHFLGLDQSYNSKHQLYLNILYDIIREGIKNESEMIDFARTAPEIKSSVGAVPKETFLYIRHKNGLLNRFVAPVVKSLQNDKEVVYRSPFKDSPVSNPSKKDGKKIAQSVSDSSGQRAS